VASVALPSAASVAAPPKMPPKVNRPADEARRAQSISQKLQVYGIYAALAQGKQPSNEQIDVALTSAIRSRALASPPSALSAEGHKLVADLADVMEKAKTLVLTKNQGELIQDFIWNIDRTSRSLKQQDGALGPDIGEKTAGGGPLTKDAAKQDGEAALAGLKTLGKLIMTNGQFRKLLSDAAILGRSMFGDAATSLAGRVNPSQEQLAQIDTPAEDNSWIETPDFGDGGLRGKLKSQYSKASSWARKNRPGSSASITIDGSAADHPLAPDDATTVSSSSSRRKEWQAKAKDYWGKKVPVERREATVDRLRKMVVEIQAHPEYQDAIVTLLNLLDTYGSHGKDYSARGLGKAEGVYRADRVQAAEKSLKTVIERFANSTSLDDLLDAIRSIQKCAQADLELRDWFRSLNTYFRRCLQQTGYVVRPEAKEEWRALYDHGQQLARDNYRPEFKRLTHEAQSFFKQFDADPANKALGQSIQNLCLDLGQDENGKPKFKPHLVKDLVSVIIPAFLENLSEVPLPRIEYSDKTIDLIVENLVIESDNLTPNMLEFKSDNHWRWGRKTHVGGNKNRVLLSIAGIHMDLRNVSYYVNKKAGFPRIADTGALDIFLDRNGLSFLIELETADRFSRGLGGVGELGEGAHYFKATNVKVNLSSLKIRVRKSTHKVLIAIMKPVLLRLLKPVIGIVAASQVKKAVAELDEVAYQIRSEFKRAVQADKSLSPDERVQQATYSRYMDLIKNRYRTSKEAKAKAKEQNPSESKFQFVMTVDQTMFPNVHLPPGVTTKATEFRNMAGEGADWRSPVFNLGSASPTGAGRLPKQPKIVRRSTWKGYKDPRAGSSGVKKDAAAGAGNVVSSTQPDHGRDHQDQSIPMANANLKPTVSQGPQGPQAPQGLPRRGVPNDTDHALPIDRHTYQRAIDPASYSQLHGDADRNHSSSDKENTSHPNPPYHRDSKTSGQMGYSYGKPYETSSGPTGPPRFSSSYNAPAAINTHDNFGSNGGRQFSTDIH